MLSIRNLKDIINDLKITAMRIGEYKYVNSVIISEAIESVIEGPYYECQSDIFEDLYKIVDGLNND